jgi:hypothetical protein
MRCRATILVAAIVSLSATAALADLRDDVAIAAAVDRHPVVRVHGDIELRAVPSSLTGRQLDDFATLAGNGVRDIVRFTAVQPPRQRIIIYLSPAIGISHTYPHFPASLRHEPRMFIDSERVAAGDAPYLHELVHAVVGNGGAMWLEEGFASWVASSVAGRYGGYYAPVLSNGNDRVDEQARMMIERSRGASESAKWFYDDDPRLGSQRDRRAFYILSHSFTKFLAASLGTHELVRIHRADDPRALGKISGRSIDEWHARWLASLGESRGRVATAR